MNKKFKLEKTDETPYCENCPYADDFQTPVLGSKKQVVCHAVPPQTIKTEHQGQLGFLTVWPVVNAQDWCGAHPSIRAQFLESFPNRIENEKQLEQIHEALELFKDLLDSAPNDLASRLKNQ